MSMMQLDKFGCWVVDTEPDHRGDLEMLFENDEVRSSAFLDIPQLRTLRDVIDNAISKCPCDYVTGQRICDEFPEYELGATDPECPFHGESET